ncbi:E3 SUMO-protein ligase RanBP2-like isoform X3 [Cydia pomonella]|uniref:E3 SUMO-protein ligase RanBP2-like isoform X3 n=1 Tax=Cydia pomonella TaxID=82600 RepID=UPI002ADD8719|nr:E3 SUMO-protein ligase RanBP2-like isoform X3 [Cydia pomonella]
MYRTKKDIDAHVESLISKLPLKEFTSRGYSIGRLYFEVGDYANCCRYVEQYLHVHSSNAAAHALLGQALQKLGKMKKALEEFKTSYELCPTQNSLVLNICEILAGDEESTEPDRAKYWCEKAEKMFPKHPVTFQLREKLLSMANPDPQALVYLLLEELAVRPKDVRLHIRLLKFYLKNNNIEEAFTHSCNIEFGENNFNNNYDWYETVGQILKCNPRKSNDWLFQLLLLTVTERMCVLSITQTLGYKDRSIFESTELLHAYDQSIERVAKTGSNPGHGEFHAGLLKHHRSQFAFIAATLLLKRGATHSWRDAARDAEPLMLMAWHSSVADVSASWVISAPETQQKAVRRWYSEGSYRCSQSGHYLLSNFNDKSQSFLDRISQNCSGIHWRDKLYGKIFSSRYHLEKINTSHLVSTSFDAPALILPKRSEVEIHDEEAQRAYGSSLHHFVWLLSKYKDFSQFKLTIFEMLPLAVQNDANCGPESLCQMDFYAFLYCAALTSRQQRDSGVPSDKPKTLPANITDLLCPLSQMKWWDCAYKFSQNELGAEITDIRLTLSRGIEIVRCVDNHGIEPELLCDLGRTFSNRAKLITDIDDKHSWELRGVLYYRSAINLLKKKSTDAVTRFEKRMFEKLSLLPKDTDSLLEECKLYVALYELNNNEYEKAIELLSPLKSAQSLYHLSVAYKKMALNENKYSQINANDDSNSKYKSLLSKAQEYAYEAHYKLKSPENKSNHMLLIKTEELINELDLHLNEWSDGPNDKNANPSDEYFSIHGNEDGALKSQSLFSRNFSSTPKRLSHLSMGPTSIPNVCDQQFIEPNDKQKSSLLKRDTAAINDLIDLARSVFEENRIVGNQIISTINSNMQNTNDQFAFLKISVDQVKEQVNECRKECKEVTELKKQIAELKKDISKIKKASEQTINENELFNLDEGYATNETASTFAAQLPFTAQQVMPPFNQRLISPFSVPPNPFQLYGQNLFNLYSQFSQPSSVPGAPPIFDAARPQVNYPGVFTNPDQMYLDVAHLAQQTAVPVIPVQASVTATVAASSLPVPHSTAPVTSIMTQNVIAKDSPRSLPANVVVTSSDPLPTSTTTPAPVLSVTVPPKHVKGIPHNYQIQMPATEPTPAFGFPSLGNKTSSNTESPNWTQNTVFKDATPTTNSHPITFSPKLGNSLKEEVSIGAANDSHNKSRTLSEKSNTSIDNYDPCPDFKPIIPLPAEVKVTTGEEDETVIFSARAKLYRFVDNQWKERGLGDMKLLKHKTTGKVRVLMRREQIHKICANHTITSYMEIKPMKNETKAYFWVANDFADETLVLEKFCVRFKTADIARQFYQTFENARSEATTSEASSAVLEAPVNLTSSKSDKTGAKNDVSKPFDVKGTPANNLQPAKTVFGGFTFSSTPAFKIIEDTKPSGKNVELALTSKINVFSGLNFKTASSTFSNLFNTSSSQTNCSKTLVPNVEATDKLNTSDTVEEYEPTGEFTPVVPLPALVDTKTGEEDEIVLFEHRAKLLRFVAKEWKERGLGNMKILVNKENPQKLRLLMRREQVMKVCCNHAVTKAMTFQKMPNVDKAVTWCAQDFSEGELTPETFCLRFKTAQACNDFIDVVKTAQSKLRDDSKAAKEELNAAKQNSQTGITTLNKPANSNWGDKFKPKQGSWECKECLVRNEANVEICPACNSPKNSGSATANTKMTEIKAPNNEVKFKFGIPQQSNPVQVAEQIVSSAQVKSSWGDMFKPAAGTWECKQCFVRNEGGVDTCCACNSPKDPNAASKPITASTTFSTPKFNFGISPTSNSNEQKANTTSIFDGTGAHKFNFGIPSNLQVKSTDNLPKSDTSSTKYVLALGTGKSCDTVQTASLTPKEKPALLPTPQKPNETATFDFVFKPKTQIKARSPAKSPKKDNGEESDGNEYASEDEGHHIHITPIIPLPDKVKVVTGEEDEDELFAHRAKLLIFVSGEWKERGLGVVKILKHKHTSKLRVVMRREQVFKICLNHALTPDITYNLKDEKNWIFAANDFTEGELTVHRFCLKFKTKEIAMQFKDAVDRARDWKNNEIQQNQNISVKSDNDNDDVEFVTETQSNSEEKNKALQLMLPENFFLYKNKDPCPGCRGCEDSKDSTSQAPKKSNISLNVFTAPTAFSSALRIPTENKAVFTPDKVNATKTANTVEQPAYSQPTNSTNKIILKPKFVSADNTSSIFRAPMLNSSIIPGAQTSTTIGTQSDPKSIFATANSNLTSNNSSLFGFKPNNNGNTEGKAVFGATVNTKLNDGQKPDGKSIFGFTSGMTNQKPFNLFNQNDGNIFVKANDVVKSDQTSAFASVDAPNYFGNGKSTLTFDPKTDSKGQGGSKSELVKLLNTPKEDKNISYTAPKALGSDSLLSFSAFKSQPELKFQKNPDFKWEGAGQQLFAQAPQSKNISDADHEVDTGNGAEEEYDPHYEPIVPLPDKITVTTGEEDEEKLFGRRCKLFRYNDATREWKERGVGELKILYHPEKKTYRLLFRREQVHKAVLNMLIFMDLELLPMSKSDRAWTWAGRNYAENPAGDQETLAVRFKTLEMATEFFDKVKECVRKLQATGARAVREEKEIEEKPKSMALLRLPKHLQVGARADNALEMKTYSKIVEATEQSKTESAEREVTNRVLIHDDEQRQETNDEEAEDYEHEQVYYQGDDYDTYYNEKLQATGAQAVREEKEIEEKPKSMALLRLPKHLQVNARADNALAMKTDSKIVEATEQRKPQSAEREVTNRVLIHDDEQRQEANDEEAEDYFQSDDYDTYYNEDEESGTYFSCDCEAEVAQGSAVTSCAQAHVQVLFDHAMYASKIQLTNMATGELLADMLIHDETEFQLFEATCSWTGTDYTSNDLLDTTVTLAFPDSETAMQFYESCESSKEHNSAEDADTEA